MLYSVILLAVVVAYAFLSPFFIIKLIKFGMVISEKPEKAVDTPVFIKPRKKEPKLTAEEQRALAEKQRALDVLANIDAYDGTGFGQKEIKDGK